MDTRGQRTRRRDRTAAPVTNDTERLEIDVGDGLHLNVERSGIGTPLLLLHGFTGSTETWAPLRASLAPRYSTIAIDLPGHGGSTSPTDPTRYALSRLADDIARVLDTLNVERAAVLGYSLGGRAALRFALKHPDRVSALILESASPGIADPAARAERIAADAALATSIEADGVAAFVDRWERLPLWASQVTVPGADRARLRVQRLTNNPEGLANSLRGAGAGAEPSVADKLSQLETPTLLVAGELDPKFLSFARQMAGLMPAARVDVIADSGHASHFERPVEFEDKVRHFLDTVAASI